MRPDLSNIGPLDVSKASEEITDNTVPDPSPLPRVAGNYILVRPVKTSTEKVGSIYIPDKIQGDVKYLHNVGRVLACGPRAFKTKEDKIIDWVQGGLKIGDIVQWERFVGKRLRFKGVNLVLLQDTAIQLVLDNPEDVDSMNVVLESD